MKTALLPRAITGLSEICTAYPAVLCDVWGVVHDGKSPLPSGIDALIAYRQTGGVAMLISNAPRPTWAVWEQMDGIGVDRECGDGLITSGDVAVTVLAQHPGARVFHLGPERDHALYRDVEIELSNLAEADLVSCTGLFDENTETPEDYDGTLAEMAARGLTMICVNPDLVVESGDRLVPCAGALAARYKAIGGDAVIVGKPHAPIYREALDRIGALLGAGTASPSDVLAIGDGIPTDIRGANDAGLDSVFVASGIHASDHGGKSPAPEDVGRLLADHGVSADYFIPRLSW